MTSLMMSILGLFVLFAVGPFLGRAVVRLLHRVPAIGAIATLALFFAFHDSDASESFDSDDSPEAHALFDSTFEPSVGWSPDHPGQAEASDEDMPDVYRSERMRYAAELESVKQAVKDFLVS